MTPNDECVRQWALEYANLNDGEYSDVELLEAVKITRAVNNNMRLNTAIELLHHNYEEIIGGK
jgi:hypothetical protein